MPAFSVYKIDPSLKTKDSITISIKFTRPQTKLRTKCEKKYFIYFRFRNVIVQTKAIKLTKEKRRKKEAFILSQWFTTTALGITSAPGKIRLLNI